MRAAGIRFAEGCYQNVLEYTLDAKGTLRFGLKAETGGNDNWCCFDNFVLYYQATPDFYDGIEQVKSSKKKNARTYSIQGYEVDESQKGLVIRNGKKILKK